MLNILLVTVAAEQVPGGTRLDIVVVVPTVLNTVEYTVAAPPVDTVEVSTTVIVAPG